MAVNLKLPKIDFRSPKFRNAAIIVGIGVVGAIAWHQMIYVKKIEQITELKSEETKKRSELNSILAMKPQLEKLREDIVLANQQLDSLRSIFPDQKEIPRLIREITRIALSTGIETKKFSPLPDVQREYYIENRFSLVIAGGYHEVARFFSSLANLELLVNLSDVSFNGLGGDITQENIEEAIEMSGEEGDAPNTVSVSFKMTTFSSKR